MNDFDKVRDYNNTIKEELFANITAYNVDYKYLIGDTGRVYNRETEKFMIPFLNKNDGYLYHRMTVRGDNTDQLTCAVHKMVAREFCKGFDESNGNVIVRHKDGNKMDNRFTNLAFTTKSELTSGPNMKLRNYSNDIVHNICDLFSKGEVTIDIYKKLSGFDNPSDNRSMYNLIIDIKCRKSYKDITTQYEY